jgi:hypothetical protein
MQAFEKNSDSSRSLRERGGRGVRPYTTSVGFLGGDPFLGAGLEQV